MSTTSLRDIALLVSLSMGGYTPNKVDRAESMKLRQKYGTTEGAARVMVDYLTGTHAAEVLMRIDSAKAEASKLWKQRTCPWDTGRRMTSNANAHDLLIELGKCRNQIETLVAEFCDVWPNAEAEARIAFNGLWKPEYHDQYRLSADQMRRRFYVSVDLEPLPSADDLRISAPDAVLRQIREQTERTIHAKFAAGCKDAYERLIAAIAAMHERLSQPDAVFRDSLVGNLHELLDLLPALNIANDQKLADIGRTARAKLLQFDAPAIITAGHTPSSEAVARTLREDKAQRASTANAARSILAELNAYVGAQREAA